MVAATVSNVSSFSSLSQVPNLFDRFHLCGGKNVCKIPSLCSAGWAMHRFNIEILNSHFPWTLKKQQQEHLGENAGNPLPR